MAGTHAEQRVWREVKVGLIARFCHRVRESGKHTFAIKQRRAVAVLGDIEALKPRRAYS